MVEQRQSTQKMRMDLANKLKPELDLYDAAFTRYCLHLVYQLVERITRDIHMVEQQQSIKRCAWNWRTR